MPSRKRAKGKEQKAKVAAQALAGRVSTAGRVLAERGCWWENLVPWGKQQEVQCNYGWMVIPSLGHVVHIS